MTESEHRALGLLAYVYLQNARPDKAAIVLAALDVLRPGEAQTLRGLALAQLRSGKPKRALDTLDRLAMAGGIDAAFHLLRAQALAAAERREEAATAMRTYVQMRAAGAAAA